MYVEGVGLEDFEECEHTFYKSNELASVTRLATPFHRQQQIGEHFHFHDLDEHEALGKYFMFINLGATIKTSSDNFIFQNYRQALEWIQANSKHLNVLASKLGTTSEDYEAYLISEHEYLLNLCVEPLEVIEMAKYIDHLIKLYQLQ